MSGGPSRPSRRFHWLMHWDHVCNGGVETYRQHAKCVLWASDWVRAWWGLFELQFKDLHRIWEGGAKENHWLSTLASGWDILLRSVISITCLPPSSSCSQRVAVFSLVWKHLEFMDCAAYYSRQSWSTDIWVVSSLAHIGQLGQDSCAVLPEDHAIPR